MKQNQHIYRKPKHRKRKVKKSIILLLVVLQLVLSSFVSCMLVFHGPFTNLRRIFVGTAMSSYKHQYFAKFFLSDEEIAKILAVDTVNVKQKASAVSIKNYNDSDIDEYQINGSKFKGTLLIVKNPLRVKVGYSNKLTIQGETTSGMAKDHNAVAAINGGGFTDKSTSGNLWTGTGAYPTCFLMSGGKMIFQDYLPNKKTDVVAFDKTGLLIVGSHSINDLKKMKVLDAFTFGPALVVNGKAAFHGDGGQGITARTAIGQKSDGSILLLVLDGRRLNMPGATLHDVQKIMLDYGAYNASNLDGGSSTTMYYKGSVINDPCNPLGERSVATSIYVK